MVHGIIFHSRKNNTFVIQINILVTYCNTIILYINIILLNSMTSKCKKKSDIYSHDKIDLPYIEFKIFDIKLTYL